MISTNKNNDGFIFCPILLLDTNDNHKTLNIPIKGNKYRNNKESSRSWSGYSETHVKPKKNFSISPVRDFTHCQNKKYRQDNIGMGLNSTSPSFYQNYPENFDEPDFKPYNAIENCKSAGIIPYSIHNGTVKFLFQRAMEPQRKKDSGLNDFGGKRINDLEPTAEIAAREFSEETSCLFYLKERMDDGLNNFYYNILKDNDKLCYNDNAISVLKNLIPISQKYYLEKITEFVSPIYVSSKETYISYFVKVPYIPEADIPRAEDIHIPYEVRYIRSCQWYTLEELIELNEKDFHKRLQITKIQNRIQNYCKKGLFI